MDTDVKIWDPIADLIPKLAKTLRGSFQPMFLKLAPSLFDYASEERDIYDNQVLVGLLAESFKVNRSESTSPRSWSPFSAN